MLFFMLAALYGTISFGNVHTLHSGVQSFVTVGSGVVLYIFNKLFSKSRVYKVDDKGLHLKEIIMRVSEKYSELWKIKDYTISVTDTDYENEADIVQTEFNGKKNIYVNNSICQRYCKGTDSQETATCCKMCCGCVILNIPDEHNEYGHIWHDEL